MVLIEDADNQHSLVSAQSLPASTNLKYRPDIDGLRAIAVSAVVIFHAFPTLLTGGFVGVDVFFVISGYLISLIIYKELDAGSYTFIQFYARRIRRIFPSLIVVLVACYIAGRHILLTAEYKKLGAHIAAGAGFVLNFVLYGESGYFDDVSDNKVLLHLWSLSIEEQFYIVWPIFVCILWKRKAFFITTTIGLTLSSFTLNVIRVKQHAIQTFYWPTSRIWELLIGACLAFILISMKDRFEKVKIQLDSLLTIPIYGQVPVSSGFLLWNIISIVGSLLIALPVFFLTKVSVFPGWWALSPTFGTALLILSGPTAWINKKVLSSRLFVGIGLISYPLYLCHWPLLVFTRIVLGRQTSNEIRIFIIIVSIILAWFTYIFIEKPLRFGSVRTVKVAVLCVSMMMIGFLGYQTYQRDGLPSRLPIIIQNVLNFTFDTRKYYRERTCFLLTQQDESQFGTCVDSLEKPASTAVVLWGDSHAAHLYPGVLAAQPDFRITQLAASSCPPIIGYSLSIRPFCKQINDYVSKRIANEKPNTVMLAASWAACAEWKKLTTTIMYLRNASIKNIYVVGPVPHWQDGLPRCLYNYFLHDKLHRVPQRMHFGLLPNIDKLDADMQIFARETNISYISPYRILCQSEGCLTRSGQTVDTLTAWDDSHFTVAGSTFVVSHFPRTLLHSQ